MYICDRRKLRHAPVTRTCAQAPASNVEFLNRANVVTAGLQLAQMSILSSIVWSAMRESMSLRSTAVGRAMAR